MQRGLDQLVDVVVVGEARFHVVRLAVLEEVVVEARTCARAAAAAAAAAAGGGCWGCGLAELVEVGAL